MYILAIETTGPKGSVALRDIGAGSGITRKNNLTDSGIYMKVTDEPMGHLRNLMAMTSDLLVEAGGAQEQGVSPSDIGLVACSVGPGSYTGIRIGVSSARAIAQALDVPCVSVGALDQFRLVALDTRKPVAVIFNARRGQVYGAVYDVKATDAPAPEIVDVLAPGPYMLTDVTEAVENLPGVVFYGDGVDAYREQLEGYELASEAERYPTAELTLRAAVAGLQPTDGRTCPGSAPGGEHGGEPDAAPGGRRITVPGTCGYSRLLPRYMRETEAEQKLRDGTLAKLREAKMAKFRSK